jgi:hypothetical protein
MGRSRASIGGDMSPGCCPGRIAFGLSCLLLPLSLGVDDKSGHAALTEKDLISAVCLAVFVFFLYFCNVFY